MNRLCIWFAAITMTKSVKLFTKLQSSQGPLGFDIVGPLEEADQSVLKPIPYSCSDVYFSFCKAEPSIHTHV